MQKCRIGFGTLCMEREVRNMTIEITDNHNSQIHYYAGEDHKYCVKVAKEFASYSWTKRVEYDGVIYKG